MGQEALSSVLVKTLTVDKPRSEQDEKSNVLSHQEGTATWLHQAYTEVPGEKDRDEGP